MSEYNEENVGQIEKDDVCDKNEFVPRFVKVFNESKTFQAGIPETNEENKNTSQKQLAGAKRMLSVKENISVTTSQSKPFEDYRRRSFKDESSFSKEKSALCKIPAMHISLDTNERRKKIVRTNTDSEIIIPKVDEAEDGAAEDEDISSPNAGSMENLKERLKEGKFSN